MRSTALALFAVAALAACTTKEARRADTTSPAAATLAGSPATDAAAVRHAIDSAYARFSAAFSRRDTVAMASTYTADAILMAPDMKAMTGPDAIAKGFSGMFAAMHPTQLVLHTGDVIVAGDYAIETGTSDMTLPDKAGKSVHDVGKYLTVWKKQPDGSYKIIRDIFNSDAPMK